MLCSFFPNSYNLTAWQYLDGITSIANYKLQDAITWVMQEESRRKATSIVSGLSLNKFSTVKNLVKSVQNVGHPTTLHKIIGQGGSVPISVAFPCLALPWAFLIKCI